MKIFKVGLNKTQAKKLVDFCHKHSEKQFFFAKDQGAYWGSTHGYQSQGNFQNCIIYIKGCNPNTNENWWDTCTERFGGDDFGEHFDVSLLDKFVKSQYKRIVFHFNTKNISVSFQS